jgi:hypothetical protein
MCVFLKKPGGGSYLMNCRIKQLGFMGVLVFLAPLIYAAEIKMGPLLHFEGTDVENHSWKVSALYLVKSFPDKRYVHFFFDPDHEEIALGKILGSRFGYDFVKFEMTLEQGQDKKVIKYKLDGEDISHRFHIPALGQHANILYHSCNGYQSEADRHSVGGINGMWAEVNCRHAIEPFELQLGGGDQIYADGLISGSSPGPLEPSLGKTFGVFALPSLQEWLSFKEQLGYAPMTDSMIEEVERFYFDHYVRHYNEPEFKETMASVPILAQPDDHDYFDGCGSYPPYLQNSPVMSKIRSIAAWYVYIIQHQLCVDELLAERSGLPAYHFLHVINKLAILGVDTRTERTQDQIVSKLSWDMIFQTLEKLDPDCQHVLVMLAVPVVYASTKILEKAINIAESSSTLNNIVSKRPGIKNSFGLFELADDGQDGWCHRAHKQERNAMILAFQDFARRKHMRVSFIGGDVHLGGAGKIYRKEIGIEDNSADAIWQIISSPVGNICVKKATARALGPMAHHERKLENGCAMRVFKLHKAHTLIAHRNFVMLKLMPDLSIDVRWSAESKKAYKAHKIYHLTIPPVHF